MEEKKKKTQRKNKKKKKYNTILVNGTRIALTCVIESNSRLKSPFLSFFRSLRLAVSPLQFSSSPLRSLGLERRTTQADAS